MEKQKAKKNCMKRVRQLQSDGNGFCVTTIQCHQASNRIFILSLTVSFVIRHHNECY